MEPQKIILYPLMGEKATFIREKDNKLTFVVDKSANKNQIKEAVEELYKVRVVQVNTMKTMKGVKKAHVKLAAEDSAEEVSSHFGVL